MYFVERHKTLLAGQHIVFEGVEEAVKMGVAPEDIVSVPKEIKRIGQWFKYSSNIVAEVKKIYQNHSSRTIVTAINAFDDRAVNPSPKFHTFQFRMKDLDLTEIDRQKLNFVTDWLFKGFEISESVRRNLIVEYRTYTLNHHKSPGKFSLLRFGYWILNYEWFDKLLEQSRPIRDRYMSLTQAFEKEGIDDEFLARKLKNNIESADGKVSNAALFKAIELVEASRAKGQKRTREIPASLRTNTAPDKQKRVRGSGLPQIPAKAESRDIYLDELENELVNIQKLKPEDLRVINNDGAPDLALKSSTELKESRKETVINVIQEDIKRSSERKADQVQGNRNGKRESVGASPTNGDSAVSS